ncbi:hypothetical protein Xmau_00730 [Xenorhabdus mauleonii]|uniref:Uncharacterized protein n=1 Tax=Xenorhabdus mauleonii TaxID=351675 RepID=A0A1I3X6M2_9GAMM|nr:hypothetical protein [Xenorhabdus mauleonii]PHM46320.1 hypothetical protein Xmau_00730 [Xenorhabdus mauleonii]SFK15180.1 hypothetical protein SAMN05421680_13220 [Xenorhabdus mauleonii]
MKINLTMNKTEMQFFIDNLIHHGFDYYTELRDEFRCDKDISINHVRNIFDGDGIYLDTNDIEVTITDK